MRKKPRASSVSAIDGNNPHSVIAIIWGWIRQIAADPRAESVASQYSEVDCNGTMKIQGGRNQIAYLLPEEICG
jgi:hypothetical protein